MAGKWLFKSDPEHYSYQDLARDRQTVWDGVSNNLALKNLRNVRRGDEVMIYHSGSERAIVGLAKVLSDPYADPKSKDARLMVVEIAARGTVPRPVGLDEIKKQPGLRDFDLVRLPRLSVMPLSEKQWEAILALAKH
ncbi:MAG TPA: EVE domain-containing protein [Terriglobia bacterium]|nr:EVE domain-containing protein [Terriglobia bacterium]